MTGAKYTSHLIPLCHNILLSKVGVHLRLAPEAHAVDIVATARTVRCCRVGEGVLGCLQKLWGHGRLRKHQLWGHSAISHP